MSWVCCMHFGRMCCRHLVCVHAFLFGCKHMSCLRCMIAQVLGYVFACWCILFSFTVQQIFIMNPTDVPQTKMACWNNILSTLRWESVSPHGINDDVFISSNMGGNCPLHIHRIKLLVLYADYNILQLGFMNVFQCLSFNFWPSHLICL